MSTIHERLKEERRRLGMKQEELASKTGVTGKSQSNYENSRYPDAEYLSKASEAGVDVGYVITGERCISQEKMQDIEEIQKKLLEALALIENIRSSNR